MTINTAICALLNYAEKTELTDKLDRAYTANKLLELLKLPEYTEEACENYELTEILDAICTYAYENKIIDGEKAFSEG